MDRKRNTGVVISCSQSLHSLLTPLGMDTWEGLCPVGLFWGPLALFTETQMRALCRALSMPGLPWHISRTWNFQGRQQGTGTETKKTTDMLHTFLCLRASQQSHPMHTWSRGPGQLPLFAHSPHPDQTHWENTVGHSVLGGLQNTTKQEDSWEGQRRETAATRIP